MQSMVSFFNVQCNTYLSRILLSLFRLHGFWSCRTLVSWLGPNLAIDLYVSKVLAYIYCGGWIEADMFRSSCDLISVLFVNFSLSGCCTVVLVSTSTSGTGVQCLYLECCRIILVLKSLFFLKCSQC